MARKRVVGARSSIGEGHAEELELRLQRTDADTEDDAAPAGDVERAVALHHLERVVVAEHEHMGEQPDGLVSTRPRSSTWRAGPSTARRVWTQWASGMTTCSGHDTHSYPSRSAARATSTMSSIPPRRSHAGGSNRGFRFTTGVTMPRRTGPPPVLGSSSGRLLRPSWPLRPASFCRRVGTTVGTRRHRHLEEAPWPST